LVKQVLIIAALVLALRLPFLHQAIQGDDYVYLYGAEHAQIDPLHPTHTSYIFRGELVDMRGHSHPPLNSWILGGLLAAFGTVKEVQFHAAYMGFSLIAAMAMLSLARRFSTQPLLATVLFCAVPAFVVNGNSLEADLPFLALWMIAMALFVYAVDHESKSALVGSALAAGLGALDAYQGIFLTPILALYVFQRRRGWLPGWTASLAAPSILGAWQIWERASSGAMPAAVLAGYMRSYHFAALVQSARGAAALVVHLAWIVSPLILLTLISRGGRWRWIAAAVGAAGAAFYDPNPLFWISFGLGVWILSWCVSGSNSQGFLGWWALLFFIPAMLVFFAGSARYLLPVAAPLAILVANASRRNVAIAGAALQMALALGLAVVNYQHWNINRHYVELLMEKTHGRRVWINADWGLRYYLEAAGGLPLTVPPQVQPGDIVVTSDLAGSLPAGVPLTPFDQIEIRPRLPLRLISLDGRSAYSFGSHGLLPFEISNAPIDRVHADIAVEPELSYLDPHDPKAAAQFISGISPDGWTAREATVLLKVPEGAKLLTAQIYLLAAAPARHITLSANGRILAQGNLPKGDSVYSISAPAPLGSASLAVTLTVDKTYSVPGDARDLGVVLTGIGFR
jgi:Dolichyl-phosphate-mannose-protein mannosyltransferase